MIKTFFRAQRTRIFWVAVLLVAIVFGLNAWYTAIYTDSRRVFDAMLENSLRTSSVTKQIVQNDEEQLLTQHVRLELGEKHRAHGHTDLSQIGLASAHVKTESIGTPTADYVRYLSIETDQKGASGNDLDFSKVIGVWGKTEASGTTSGELYNEIILGVIPVGNLSASDRRELLKLASDLEVYKVEYKNVRRGSVNGRPSYEYTVKVLPEEYVTLLKRYAQMVGLTHLDNVNPGSYSNSPAIEFKVVVDVNTRRLATVTYESGRQERFIGYGSQASVGVPKDAVTVEELQSRLQNIQ